MRSNFLKDFKLDMQWRTLKEPFRLKKCLMECLLFSSLREQSNLVNFKKIGHLWKPIERCFRKNGNKRKICLHKTAAWIKQFMECSRTRMMMITL